MMRTATLLGLTCAGLLLSGCGLGPFSAAAPTPSAVATTAAAAATSAPTATRAAAAAPATATPAPPKPTNTAEPQPSETVWVGNTDGEGVYLRNSPVMADRARAYVDGTPLTVVGEDVDGDDQHWKHVRAPDGFEGYVPSIYTVDTPP
jgi:hypothetical protein